MKMKKYNLYIGLNDKDIKKQIYSETEAKEKTIKILSNNNINALTMYKTLGVFTHEDGTKTIEKSLKVELLEVKEDDVLNSIKELKKKLNQESIILEIEEKEIYFI